MRILLFDVETAPLLGHVWHPFGDYMRVNQLVNESFMLTWAAKWYDGRDVESNHLTGREAQKQNDKRLVRELAALVKEADAIIAHNLDRFDLKVLNGRLLYHGLDPLPPVVQIDTLKLAKGSFKVAFNRLDYLGEFLGVGRKIKTDFDLWKGAYMGDEDALREMTVYNEQDVILLEAVFNKIKPYVKNLPRLVDPSTQNELACPSCGSTKLQRRGYYRTRSANYAKVQCQECKRYSRFRTAEPFKFAVHPL